MHLWSLEILEGIRKKLGKRNIGGQVFQAAQILDEVRGAHNGMISTLANIGNCARTKPAVQQDVQQQEVQNSPNFNDISLNDPLDKKRPIGGVGELSIAKANPTDHTLQ
eukprot:3171642-Ditylum_brightwellii.AAC.1